MARDFEDMFRVEYPRLVRALTLVCGDPEVAADVAQDAFLQAHRHWRRIGTYTDHAGWLRHVATNRLANRHRGRRRLQGFLTRTTPAAVAPSAPAAPDDLAATLDLRAAVAALSPQQRMVVALHHLLDLPVTEVARTLDIAPATVRSHLHAARRALAVRLAPDDTTPTPGRTP